MSPTQTALQENFIMSDSTPLRILTICLFFLAAAATAANAEPKQETSANIYHTVVFWLKPETTSAKIDEIIRLVKTMEDLPMVERVFVGTPVMSERAVVDDSFSVAFTMVFENKTALDAFAADPYHKRVSGEETMPHVLRAVIYDYQDQ